jgi:hypothetical protein
MAKNKGRSARFGTCKNRTRSVSIEHSPRMYRTLMVVESLNVDLHTIEAVVVDGDLRMFDGIVIDADTTRSPFEELFCRRFFGTVPQTNEQGDDIVPPSDHKPQFDYKLKRQDKHYMNTVDIVNTVVAKKYDYRVHVTVYPR